MAQKKTYSSGSKSSRSSDSSAFWQMNRDAQAAASRQTGAASSSAKKQTTAPSAQSKSVAGAQATPPAYTPAAPVTPKATTPATPKAKTPAAPAAPKSHDPGNAGNAKGRGAERSAQERHDRQLRRQLRVLAEKAG